MYMFVDVYMAVHNQRIWLGAAQILNLFFFFHLTNYEKRQTLTLCAHLTKCRPAAISLDSIYAFAYIHVIMHTD